MKKEWQKKKEKKKEWQTCTHHRIRFFKRLPEYESRKSGYFQRRGGERQGLNFLLI